MEGIWLMVLLSREEMHRASARLARVFRDVVSSLEVAGAVDEALVEAAARFDPARGRFREFAKRFVVRFVYRLVKRELRWRRNHLPLEEGAFAATDTADADTRRRELQELLGATDYELFVAHFAWGRSIRSIERDGTHSFRAVRDSLRRSRRLVRRELGHDPGCLRRSRTAGTTVRSVIRRPSRPTSGKDEPDTE